jgi:hypothetical protein
MGQGRDCIELFGEDRMKIPKQSWRGSDREKTGESASDPTRQTSDGSFEIIPAVARSLDANLYT